MLPPVLPPMHAMRTPQPTALPSLKHLHVGAPAASAAAGDLARTIKSEPVAFSPSHENTTRRLEDDDADDASSLSRSPRGSAEGAGPDDKRARRKEQCRVNQANYRKRKRQHELQLAGYIQSLELEIQELTTRRQLLTEQRAPSSDDDTTTPEHGIASFYYMMQTPPAARSPGSECASMTRLLDLQCEEFASLQEMMQAWDLKKRGFQTFQLHALSSERIEVGDHAIIKMEAELEIVFFEEKLADNQHWWRRSVVCQVQQRFEIDSATNAISRITSEVDLVMGISASTQQTPQAVSEFLMELRHRHSF